MNDDLGRPQHFILDAHLDIAMNAVALGRDFRDAAWVKRRREGKFPGAKFDQIGVATVGLPDMLVGRVGIAFATLWVNPPWSDLVPAVSYQTPQQAYQQAIRQWDYYSRLYDQDDRVRLIRTQAELNTVLASWQANTDLADHKIGLVLLMEGADPITEPRQLEEWYHERGLRIIGLAWQETRYAGGTHMPGGLTDLGRELLAIMSEYNMILDLSHLAEAAYYEAIDRYEGVLIASHSNPRKFMDSDRNLSDKMIRRLAERDGVMGVVLFNEFMQDGWKRGRDPKHMVGMQRVLEMIDHICQLTGSAQHVGIGTDWDGGFGWESIPTPFDTHLDLLNLERHLLERYDPDDVQNILYGNFLRQLQKSLPT